MLYDLLKDAGFELGLVGVLLVFFIWRDWQRSKADAARERTLSARIVKLEKDQTNILLPMLENAVSVIARNTLVMERLENVLSFFDECRDKHVCPVVNPKEQ